VPGTGDEPAQEQSAVGEPLLLRSVCFGRHLY
jgi:hypothetical protein